jgi:hypothetical protein
MRLSWQAQEGGGESRVQGSRGGGVCGAPHLDIPSPVEFIPPTYTFLTEPISMQILLLQKLFMYT